MQAGRRISLALALALLAVFASAAPSPAQVSLVRYPDDSTLFPVPYYVTSPPGDTSRVFVVQGSGQVRVVKDGVVQPEPFLDISDDPDFLFEEANGLFSIAFPPDYASSGRFYLQYTRDSPVPEEDHYLVTEEFRRSASDPDLADESTRREVLVIPHLLHDSHSGGQVQFGPDGLLYISTGDGGGAGDPEENAQDKTSLLGKLLRIDPSGGAPGEYSVPAGNPFAGPGHPGADEVYSYGLRNPWRFSFDRLTGDLTIGDVGEGAREEIDFVSTEAGRGLGVNFGWPCREGAIPYAAPPASCATSTEVFEDPSLDYSNPFSGLAAVVGGYVVRDGALPSLLGSYVYADSFDGLGAEIFAARLGDSGATEVGSLGLTLDFAVSFGEDACAHVYVTSPYGGVYRLEPSSGPFPCDPRDQPEPPTVGVSAEVKRLKAKPRPAAKRARARWHRAEKRRRAARRRAARR